MKIENRQKELPPRMKTVDFICPKCKGEFIGEAVLGQYIIKCRCGNEWRIDKNGRPHSTPSA